jgi:hypothetical protein
MRKTDLKKKRHSRSKSTEIIEKKTAKLVSNLKKVTMLRGWKI